MFFQQLRERCEGLTPAMERLAALIFYSLIIIKLPMRWVLVKKVLPAAKDA
ncbi:hypothetical protein LWM68_46795 [Niabella sp. W65]|nr:hypothetical protein [Niabella sp. W65]MCH7369580.1 hypothetical protein [Niabella sp. W65]